MGCLIQGRKGKEHTSIVHISEQNQTHLGKLRSYSGMLAEQQRVLQKKRWELLRKSCLAEQGGLSVLLKSLVMKSDGEQECQLHPWAKGMQPAERQGQKYFMCIAPNNFVDPCNITVKSSRGLDQTLIPLKAVPCLASPDKTLPSLVCELN